MKKAVLMTLLLAGLVLAGALVFSAQPAMVKNIEPPVEPEPQKNLEVEPMQIPENDFHMEILVGGVPLEEYYARGKRYVEAREGAEYVVRIYNPLPVRVAVALSVDGLNTIDARRTSGWDASKWVILPYQSITIKGWQMSSARARHFYFTSERDSYATRIGRPGNQGTISAVFFREREIERRPPPPIYEPRGRYEDESKDKSSAESARQAPSAAAGANSSTSTTTAPAAPEDYAATGIGRSVRHDVQWVNLDLLPGPAGETSIRYEYRPQLVRLGVLPKPYYPRPDPLDRRERSTGFENRRYSPEP